MNIQIRPIDIILVILFILWSVSISESMKIFFVILMIIFFAIDIVCTFCLDDEGEDDDEDK